jgi:predicted GH43/DUF377 family glycosyl hydrolase
MWFAGHDGTTCRILEAVQAPGCSWQQVGLSIDTGMWGDTDAFGVESPSVVTTPGGYLMAYAGSDGADTRLHIASSKDGHEWEALGPFIQREGEDAIGATHPCLVVTRDRWWLFYSGYDGSFDGRRAVILAAVSRSGASWDRIGPILEPDDDAISVTEPCVVISQRHLFMFYVTEVDKSLRIDIATSEDAIEWHRQGTALSPGPETGNTLAVRSPCALRLLDGTLHLWYAARQRGDMEGPYRLWTTEYGEEPEA